MRLPETRNITVQDAVAANSFIATGGDGFTVFDEASATQQKVGIPPDFGQRITKQG